MSDTTLNERVAVLTAHRICHNIEHDGLNGKQAGCCIVCGVPWPCAYAGTPTPDPRIEAAKGMYEALKYPRFGDTAQLFEKCLGMLRQRDEKLRELTGENWTSLYLHHFSNAITTMRAALEAWEKLQ